MSHEEAIAEIARLENAIRKHQRHVKAAGSVHVRDLVSEAKARLKQRADNELWGQVKKDG